MSDQPELQTCPDSFFAEEDADVSERRSALGEDYQTDDQAAPSHKKTSFDLRKSRAAHSRQFELGLCL